MQQLNVNLGDRSYPIIVEKGILPQAGEFIAKHTDTKKTFIITDENVAPLYLKQLQTSLDAVGVAHHAITLPAGESTKSFANLQKITEEILEQGIERNHTLIALGGGVIGDITGFAASVLLRGVQFVQIPTTLLAMVDSSVGGKTAINTASGKNLVGSFYQPKCVIADVSTLDTLPEREYRAGYAEVVKYGLINDKAFFDKLDVELMQAVAENPDDIVAGLRKNEIANIIHSCKSKAAIVAEDEKERGKRALLNLGHTFGHALEAEMGYDGRLLHGEAVAMGIAMIFIIAAKDDYPRVATHLSLAGFKLLINEIDPTLKVTVSQLLDHMQKDKKVSNGKINFILPRSIGDCYISDKVDLSTLENSINSMSKL